MRASAWCGGDEAIFLAAGLSDADLDRRSEESAGRWARSRELTRAAAASAGVRILFAIQPVPWFGYDLTHHLFLPGAAEVETLERLFAATYSRLALHVGEDTVDCSRTLADFDRPAWVDAHHYSSEAASKVVDCLLVALAEPADSPADSPLPAP